MPLKSAAESARIWAPVGKEMQGVLTIHKQAVNPWKRRPRPALRAFRLTHLLATSDSRRGYHDDNA
jgi:hypothetical protein